MRDEFRFALRRIVKHPAPALASVVTLASAIAAAAATGSLLSALQLNPLPGRDPTSVDVLAATRPPGGIGPAVSTTFTYPAYPAVRDSHAFAEVAGAWLTAWPFTIAEQKTAPAAMAVFVSANFFDVLGIQLPHGRSFTTEDDRRGAPPVAVVSDRFWRTRLNGDLAALGRVLTLDRSQVTIVGIAPRKFRGLTLTGSPDVYLPLQTIADVGPSFFNYFASPDSGSSPTAGVTIVGRARPRETPEQIGNRLGALTQLTRVNAVARALPINSTAVPLAARETTAHFARLLAGTVTLLLLIGCCTVGMLLLVRTEGRRLEFATCLALGASRAQLARGIAIEGAALTAAAAGLSPLAAWWMFAAIQRYQLPGGISLELLELRLDAAALGITLAVAVIATTVVGLVAAGFAVTGDVADSLRARSGATPRLRRRFTRAALLTTHVAVALALVAGMGLFARSLLEALALNARFDSGRIASTHVGLVGLGYSPERAGEFYADLLRRAARNPAIADLATSASAGGMGARGTLTIDGQPRQFPHHTAFDYVDDSYFRTMRMRILRGRSFGSSDRSGAPQVGIVSESFGRMIASGGDPVGRRIAVMMGGKLDVEIVGVTEDLFTTVRDGEPLALYMPVAQSVMPAVNRTLVFRAAAGIEAAQREIAAALKSGDPRIEPARAMSLDDRLLREMAPQRFAMMVLGTLGSIALVLTLLATYVLAESMAAARGREMGIRAALGASRSRLVAIVLGDAATVVGIGLGAGLFIAWAGAGTLRALLFRVHPLDPFTLLPTAALILALALAVSLRPALRAARIDLNTVLRAE